jgi:hypothetical protein
VELLEDRDDYQAFEEAVAADFTAESAVERELVLRLASLLWRLRRATAIETDLMSFADDILNERQDNSKNKSDSSMALAALFGLGHRSSTQINRDANYVEEAAGRPHSRGPEGVVARRFVRLANDGHIERLSRYEMTLWRQLRQTLFTLEVMRWRGFSSKRSHRFLWGERHKPPD